MKSLLLSVLFFVLGSLAMLWLGAHSQLAPPTPPAPVIIETQVVPVHDAAVPANERVTVDGVPVPIYPGSRVAKAEIRPPAVIERRVVGTKVETPSQPYQLVRLNPPPRTVAGLLSATEKRAKDSAEVQLKREVAEWLAPEVPTSWKPSADLLKRTITATRVKPVIKDYGTLYEATLDIDNSSAHRQEFIQSYQNELVAERLGVLAGVIGFVLICLAALAGYIRADEATKGYYTHWLRGVAAAGVGASGVLIYQLLT